MVGAGGGAQGPWEALSFPLSDMGSQLEAF